MLNCTHGLAAFDAFAEVLPIMFLAIFLPTFLTPLRMLVTVLLLVPAEDAFHIVVRA